jgi:F-type H+-transporting ATPase subunit delta
MISERIARRYVRALFGLAAQAAAAEALAGELADLQALYRASPDLQHVLGDPRLPAERKRGLLLHLIGEEAAPLLGRFLDLLLVKRRLDVLHYVGTIFAELQDEAAGIRRARVLSAAPLTDAHLARLRDALATMLDAQIVVSAQTDPDLIGGLHVRIGDLQIDGTIARRLDDIRELLCCGGPTGVRR